MPRLFTILAFILFANQVSSQQLYQQWTTTFGNSAQHHLQANNTMYSGNIVSDENGNSYLYFMDNVITAIVKYNNLGQVVWKVDNLPYVSFPCEDIYSQNALTYQNGYLYLVSNGGLQKFDLDGNLIWFWHCNALLNNGSRPDTWLWIDSSDNAIIAYANTNGNQMNIAKIREGNLIWSNHYAVSNTALSDFVLRIDNSGNSYLSYTGNWPIIDGNDLASLINKYDTAGNLLWSVHSYAGTGDNAPQIEIQSNGDVWAFANDSLKVYAADSGTLKKDVGRYHFYAPLYHNNNFHYYAYGQAPYYIDKLDNNGNVINTFNGPSGMLYLQGFYASASGHLYIISANTTTDIIELGIDLQLTNHLVVETMNGGATWSTGGTDTAGNFYMFSAINGYDDSAELFKFCSGCQPNVIGKLYVDSNQNCSLDSSESGLGNNIITITPGPYYAVTDQQGNYSSLLPPSTYTVTPSRKMYWNASCGDSIVFVLNPPDTLVTVPNFGIYPEKNVCDDGISIWATDANPGYYQNVYVSYENSGTDIDSGFVEVRMDRNFIYMSATPSPDSISGLKLFWRYDSLLQDEWRYIVITDSVPTLVPQFSLYEFIAQIIPFANDTNPGNNFDEVINEVYSSYDPNEKVCTVKRANALGFVEDSSLLVYRISFENTGSDTARQIVVVDTIDNSLDMASFTLLTSSIPGCQLQLVDNNIVSFIFKPAMLPDSSVNNAGSQGYVSFSIRPKQNLNSGQLISNTATIYFDFNPGVSTNTTINYYHSLPTDVRELNDNKGGVKVYPNPTSAKLNVLFTKPSGNACQIFVYDIAGRSVADYKFDTDYNISFNTEALTNGVYFIAVKENDLILNTVKFVKL